MNHFLNFFKSDDDKEEELKDFLKQRIQKRLKACWYLEEGTAVRERSVGLCGVAFVPSNAFAPFFLKCLNASPKETPPFDLPTL